MARLVADIHIRISDELHAWLKTRGARRALPATTEARAILMELMRDEVKARHEDERNRRLKKQT